MQTQSVKRARKPRALSPAMRAALPATLKDNSPLGTVKCVSSDPLAYGMIVKGDCLAPEIMDGDTVICSPSTKVMAGMIVVITFHDGRMAAVKRLTFLPRPPHPDDEIEVLVRVEMTNPPKTFFLPRSVINKMHAVSGVVRDGRQIEIEAKPVSAAVRRLS